MTDSGGAAAACCSLAYLLHIFNQGWVGTVIGLIGIGVAFELYRRSRVRPRLFYQERFTRVVGSPEAAFPSEVEIRFAGSPVPRVSKSTIVFWNGGSSTARGSDIVEADPIRLRFQDGCQVLQAQIAVASRPVNGVMVTRHDHDAVEISFDFLDPGDGCVVEILHTDSKRTSRVSGTVRGIPRGVEWRGRIREPVKRAAGFVPVLVLAVGTAFGVATFAVPFSTEPAFRPERVLRAAFGGLSVIYVALAASMFWVVRRRYPKSLATEPPDGVTGRADFLDIVARILRLFP